MAKILFLVPNDWYLFSHRQELLATLIEKGHDVHVLTEISVKTADIPKPLDKATFHPFIGKGYGHDGLVGVYAQMKVIRKIIKCVSPDIIHIITIRFLFLAPYLSFGFKYNTVISIAGLGGLKNLSPQRQIFVGGFLWLARRFLGSRRVRYIFQNTIDAETLIGQPFAPLVEKGVYLIRGAGVDIMQFSFCSDIVARADRLLFAGRLLRSKGVLDFIEVAKSLDKSHGLRPTIAGRIDSHASDSLGKDEILQATQNTDVELFFDCQEIDKLMQETAIFVLPSRYAEGLPKVVLEAMATGAVVITTDWPDHDKVIDDGKTGMIIRKSELTPAELEKSILALVNDNKLRIAMATKARKAIEKRFSAKDIVDQHLKVYDTWIKETND